MSAAEWSGFVVFGIALLGLAVVCLSTLSQEIRAWTKVCRERSTSSTPGSANSGYDPNEVLGESECVPPVATRVAAYSEMNEGLTEGLTIILNEGLPSKTIMASRDLYESFKSDAKEVK